MELNKTVEAEALRLQGEQGQKSVIEWSSGSKATSGEISGCHNWGEAGVILPANSVRLHIL